MIQDGRAGKFDIVLAEGMERISRGQADIASIYDNMTFARVKMITLQEGDVTQMLIGFKGTMNAVTLADLSTKTHRGLRGRIEAGKSGGGNAYDYKVLCSLHRGWRTQNAATARSCPKKPRWCSGSSTPISTGSRRTRSPTC